MPRDIRCVVPDAPGYRQQPGMILQPPFQHFCGGQHYRQWRTQLMTDVGGEPAFTLERAVELVGAILDRAGQYADLVGCIEAGKRFLSLLVLNGRGQLGQRQNHPTCAGPPDQQSQCKTAQERQAQGNVGTVFYRLVVGLVIHHGVALAVRLTDQGVQRPTVHTHCVDPRSQLLQRLRYLLVDEEIQVASSQLLRAVRA
ncbi:hypothetical protein D3C84_866050 [compost metagenome]